MMGAQTPVIPYALHSREFVMAERRGGMVLQNGDKGSEEREFL